MSTALKQVFNKDKTFRPKRKFEPGTQRFELHKRAQATLHSGVDLKAAVQLPRGEDQNDWVAVHVVDFFNRINLIYGTICEFCTERSSKWYFPLEKCTVLCSTRPWTVRNAVNSSLPPSLHFQHKTDE
uniref:MOB kinase activator 3A n=1 Tax=Pavo cristatus TaxID=9049 RepID=A0A8C9F797_PAVCR